MKPAEQIADLWEKPPTTSAEFFDLIGRAEAALIPLRESHFDDESVKKAAAKLLRKLKYWAQDFELEEVAGESVQLPQVSPSDAVLQLRKMLRGGKPKVEKKYFTVEEIAEYGRMTTTQVYAAVHKRQIGAGYGPKNKLIFTHEMMDDYLAEKKGSDGPSKPRNKNRAGGKFTKPSGSQKDSQRSKGVKKNGP